MCLDTRFVFLLYKNKKNHKINTRKKPMISLAFLGVRSSSTHVAGLNPTGLAGSLAQTSDLAGHKGMREFPHACLG
jgi:hypothetical protein